MNPEMNVNQEAEKDFNKLYLDSTDECEVL